MSKVHEYLLVRADGKYEIAKSNGPICFQQSRQEVGGHFETFDPQLGHGFTAQINEEGGRLKLPPNGVFSGVAGNVLIGRAHGTGMWGLSAGQREELLARLQLNPISVAPPVSAAHPVSAAPPPENATDL